MSAVLKAALVDALIIGAGIKSDDPDAEATVMYVDRLRDALQALYDDPLSIEAARAVQDLL